jgi:hypothetical protein
MTMAITFAVPIVQPSSAQSTLDLFAQSLGHKTGVALTASDAAYVGRVDIELHGDPLVDTAKNGERFKRVRGKIRLVTIHDFLLRRSDLLTTVTTLTEMVYPLG